MTTQFLNRWASVLTRVGEEGSNKAVVQAIRKSAWALASAAFHISGARRRALRKDKSQQRRKGKGRRKQLEDENDEKEPAEQHDTREEALLASAAKFRIHSESSINNFR